MRVLLLSDRSFAAREHSMLRRLEIGLVDEGCRVARVAPAGAFAEASAGLALAAEYSDSRWRVLEPSPVKRIARALEETSALGAAGGEGTIDVVHAWGESCWPLALALARALDAGIVLEIWSRHSLGLVTQAERRGVGVPGLWLAPDGAMSVAVERLARRWPVRTSLWGVHVPGLDANPRIGEAIESLCILAPGREPRSTIDLCTALARVNPGLDGPMLFLDASVVESSPQVWSHAGAMGLRPRLTIVPEMESRRDLVLKTDALAVPECQGEHRSLVLEAMAAGMAVVARSDRLIDIASEQACALLVEEPSEAGWARAMSWLLTKPAEARAMGREARAFIAGHRLAHMQVRAALDAYAVFLRDRPIRLDGASRD